MRFTNPSVSPSVCPVPRRDRLRRRTGFAGSTLLAVLCGGCGLKPLDYPADLASPHPSLRVRAARAAVERNDQAAVPLLVDRLEDEDAAVRLYAAQALRRLTGKDLEYRHYHPPAARARAVERWRHYVLSARDDDGASPTAASAPADRAGDTPAGPRDR